MGLVGLLYNLFNGKRKLDRVLVCIIVMLMTNINLIYSQEQDSASVDTVKQNKTRAILQKLLNQATQESIQDVMEKQKAIAKKDTIKDSSDEGLEIDGLLINETKTKIGQDFYEFFFNFWQAPDNAKDYTLFVSERPTGNSGSWIWVNVNETTVFQNRLTPKADLIEETASSAVSIITNYLINLDQNQRQLAGDEMAGTGIF